MLKRTRWKRPIECFNDVFEVSRERLDDLGIEGWELCSINWISVHSSHIITWWKRPISDAEVKLEGEGKL